MPIKELRLGPVTNYKGKEIALEELLRKLNEVIRELNKLLEGS